MIQDAGRRIGEVVVDGQAGAVEFEQGDVRFRPGHLEGVDRVVRGHGLGLPFQVAGKESVQDRHFKPVIWQVQTQEVEGEIQVEPAGVQVVQQAAIGHADERAELDPGDPTQSHHATDGAVPDDLVEAVLRIQVVPDRVLGRHLKMPHETEALQGLDVGKQDVTCRGQGVIVKLHDFLLRIHLREHFAPRDIEREDFVERTCFHIQHSIVALNESGNCFRVNWPATRPPMTRSRQSAP